MSEFTILYKTLHCEQKELKKADKNEVLPQAKSETKPESTVNPFRALVARIF